MNGSRGMPVDGGEPLQLDQQLTLPFRFAAGSLAGHFFRTLEAERRIVGRRCPNGHVLLPPRPVCGLCQLETEAWVEVGPGATLGGYTVVHTPFTDPMTGVARPVPYGFGLIHFDGADTSVYHLIEETDPAALRIGMRLEPVWRAAEECEGSLTDIRGFRPVAS